MSTWIYLQCLDHNPPLVADDESGQHTYDLPQIREDIAKRKTFLALGEDVYDLNLEYFRKHTVRFLIRHPECNIGIKDEYGVEYALQED